jgi:hypothetical protein
MADKISHRLLYWGVGRAPAMTVDRALWRRFLRGHPEVQRPSGAAHHHLWRRHAPKSLAHEMSRREPGRTFLTASRQGSRNHTGQIRWGFVCSLSFAPNQKITVQ